MATVTHDDLWFCEDCTLAFDGADVTITDAKRAESVEAGMIRLSALGHVIPQGSESSEDYRPHASTRCDCCGDSYAGPRHRHAILGA